MLLFINLVKFWFAPAKNPMKSKKYIYMAVLTCKAPQCSCLVIWVLIGLLSKNLVPLTNRNFLPVLVLSLLMFKGYSIWIKQEHLRCVVIIDRALRLFSVVHLCTMALKPRSLFHTTHYARSITMAWISGRGTSASSLNFSRYIKAERQNCSVRICIIKV